MRGYTAKDRSSRSCGGLYRLAVLCIGATLLNDEIDDRTNVLVKKILLMPRARVDARSFVIRSA